MNPVPTILAATDLSAHARHAVERAARVAHESAARLTLLHVLPGGALEQMRAWLGAGSSAESHLIDEARAQMQALARRLHGARQVDVEPVLREGTVVDATLQEAERIDARLLVLGARGAGFMRRLLIGTSSERLMRKTTRPVLVVRQTPHERYRRVLVALDGSPYSAGALEAARWVAPHAQLVLASVVQLPFAEQLRFAGVDDTTISRYRDQAHAEATRRLHALADAAALPASHWQPCVVEGDPSLRLLELEQEHDCDLVVVGKHGSSAAVDLLLGSVTHRLVSDCEGDVLVSTRTAASAA